MQKILNERSRRGMILVLTYPLVLLFTHPELTQSSPSVIKSRRRKSSAAGTKLASPHYALRRKWGASSESFPPEHQQRHACVFCLLKISIPHAKAVLWSIAQNPTPERIFSYQQTFSANHHHDTTPHYEDGTSQILVVDSTRQRLLLGQYTFWNYKLKE